MSYTPDTLVSTLSARPHPWVFRTIAYALMLSVALADVLMGASPLAALFGAFVLACLARFVLPPLQPRTNVHRRVVTMVSRLYFLRLRYQLVAAVIAFLAIEVLDYHLGGFRLGRIFNIYMAAVFSHALVFGLRSSVLVWLLATVTVYFAEIPPEYSFRINSITSFLDVFVFMYVGLLALASAYVYRLGSIIGVNEGQ